MVLAGFMDGSVAVFNAHTGALLHRASCHSKYCVRVRWMRCGADAHGQRFVTCSWDHTVGVHALTGKLQKSIAACTLFLPLLSESAGCSHTSSLDWARAGSRPAVQACHA